MWSFNMTNETKMKNGAKKGRGNPLFILLFVVLAVYAVILLLPMVWGFFTSLKTLDGFMDDKIWPSAKMTFENFVNAFKGITYTVNTPTGSYDVFFPEMLLNSFIFAAGGALCTTFVTCITAYLVAKFPYKFSKFVYGAVIVTMILPVVGSLPAQVRMAKLIGVHDTMWGALIMSANFTNLYFLVFYATFKATAKDYSEAASIDGAGNFTIFARLMLPLVGGTFFIVFLMHFITRWNDYQTPFIFLESHPVVSSGIYRFALNDYSQEPVKVAGGVIMFLPVLVLFLLFYKKMMSSFSVGGLKG